MYAFPGTEAILDVAPLAASDLGDLRDLVGHGAALAASQHMGRHKLRPCCGVLGEY